MIIDINLLNINVSTNTIIISIILALKSRNSLNLFAKRIDLKNNEIIKNIELEYKSIEDENNENKSDIFIIIEKKSNEKNEDFSV